MTARVGSLREYLRDLEKRKKDKPPEVRDALEVYLQLWKKAMARGVVAPDDGMERALAKVNESGGLYKAAGD